MRRVLMRNRLKGSFTIEASVIVPVILMMFIVVVYTIFYYHDKSILGGAAYETAVVGTDRIGYGEEELETYFRKRIRGKLIFFSGVQQSISVEEEKISVECTAVRKGMRVCAKASARRTEPEKYIRNIRKAQKLGERLGE